MYVIFKGISEAFTSSKTYDEGMETIAPVVVVAILICNQRKDKTRKLPVYVIF